MGTIMNNTISLTPLKNISTAGGDVLHGFKNTDTNFTCFGEAYFSCVMHESVKAWKKHSLMTMNLIVPVGKVRFVFKSDSDDDFYVEEIGIDNYARLTVPPGVWFGFQGLCPEGSLILNIADILHSEGEVERCEIGSLNFDWSK